MVPSSLFPRVYLLGGLTGSGKTELLRHLFSLGKQVLDLENLCNHDGSAFASLQFGTQPTSWHFNKKLNKTWQSFDLAKPVFIEHELQRIGKLVMPGWLYKHMLTAPVIWLNTDRALRIKRISTIIRKSDPVIFCNCVSKLSRRLNEEVIASVIRYFEKGDVDEAAGLLLDYYDNTNGYAVPNERILFRMNIIKPGMMEYCEILLDVILQDAVTSITH